MIRNAIHTVYNGTEYRIFHNRYGKYILVSHDKNDESKGFIKEDEQDEIYLKEVTPSEVGEVYHINTLAEYKGVTVGVEKESETQYLLFKGYDKYGSLGFDLVAKGEYEKWINKDEVSNVHEVKRPIPDYFDD